jgi:DNA-binding transcriptional regulator GbsR (MarR family)
VTKLSESSKGSLNEIQKKLEEMDNKLERIKSDTHNLNRIASLSNSGVIVKELEKVIGTSKVRAAILHLTKDEIGAGELANAVGISLSNLKMYIRPFLGNRGYIAEIKRGNRRFFQRSELVDLIGFEATEPYSTLLESWKRGRQEVNNAD